MREFLLRSGWNLRAALVVAFLAALIVAGGLVVHAVAPAEFALPDFAPLEPGQPLPVNHLEVAYPTADGLRIARAHGSRLLPLEATPLAFADDLAGGVVVQLLDGEVAWHRTDGRVEPIELPADQRWLSPAFLEVSRFQGRRVLLASVRAAQSSDRTHTLLRYDLEEGVWNAVASYRHPAWGRAAGERYVVLLAPERGCRGIQLLDEAGRITHRFRNDLTEGRGPCRGEVDYQDAILGDAGDELVAWTMYRWPGWHERGAFVTRIDLATGEQRSWGTEWAEGLVACCFGALGDQRYVAGATAVLELTGTSAVLRPIDPGEELGLRLFGPAPTIAVGIG